MPIRSTAARLLVRPPLLPLALLAGVLGAARPLAAQEPAPTPAPIMVSDTAAVDAALARAQHAVGSGSTSAARALLDSLAIATEPASPRYPELLFWRATYAATAAQAERDYRRIAVEYAMSPRAEDALMRLAQLELARGDQALAIRHLERLVLEHPESRSRPRASYWMGRAYLERGETAKACEALGQALATAPAGEVELRNQVTYAGTRCPRGWDQVAARPVGGAPAPAVGTAVAGAAVAGVPPASTIAAKDTTRVIDSSRVSPAARAAIAAGDTMMRAAVPPDSLRAAPAHVDSAPAAATTAGGPPPNTTVAPPARAGTTDSTPRVSPRRGAPAFSVQVAAYDTRREAEVLASRLRGRGLDARVAAAAQAPYRVRLGRWSRAEAVRQKTALAAKGIAGFVVEAEAAP